MNPVVLLSSSSNISEHPTPAPSAPLLLPLSHFHRGLPPPPLADAVMRVMWRPSFHLRGHPAQPLQTDQSLAIHDLFKNQLFFVAQWGFFALRIWCLFSKTY